MLVVRQSPHYFLDFRGLSGCRPLMTRGLGFRGFRVRPWGFRGSGVRSAGAFAWGFRWRVFLSVLLVGTVDS